MLPDDSTRVLPLTRGRSALVDTCDYEWLSGWAWSAVERGSTWYAQRGETRAATGHHVFYMHREILGLKRGDGMQTDHINHNGLDNRRENLRVATGAQNFANSRSRTGTSRYKGVSWRVRERKWISQTKVNGRAVHLGYFDNEEDAARAYDRAIRRLLGPFALVNFPDGRRQTPLR